MKKKSITRAISLLLLLALIGTVFFLLTSCDSNSDDPTADAGKKVPVYDENNNLTGYEIHSYNRYDLLSRLDVYDKDDNYLYFKTFEYDSSDRLIQETWYKSNGIGDYYYTYDYDDDGNMIEKGYYPAQGHIEIILYDSKGNETDKLYYDDNDQLEIHSKFEDGKWVDYDADDKPIE